MHDVGIASLAGHRRCCIYTVLVSWQLVQLPSLSPLKLSSSLPTILGHDFHRFFAFFFADGTVPMPRARINLTQVVHLNRAGRKACGEYRGFRFVRGQDGKRKRLSGNPAFQGVAGHTRGGKPWRA